MTATLTRPRYAICWCTDASHDPCEQFETFHAADAADLFLTLGGSPSWAHVTEAAA